LPVNPHPSSLNVKHPFRNPGPFPENRLITNITLVPLYNLSFNTTSHHASQGHVAEIPSEREGAAEDDGESILAIIPKCELMRRVAQFGQPAAKAQARGDESECQCESRTSG